MSLLKLSIVSAVLNEENNLERVLKSVKDIADEIIIVDGGSTDNTVKTAEQFQSRVINKANQPMFHRNKQIGITAASHEWILLLDADEEITADLAKEIKKTIKNADHDEKVFRIRRKNLLFGKWLGHTGWWPDWQIRLFRKGSVYFECKSIHEHPKVRHGKVGELKNYIKHYNYSSVSQYLDKLSKYTADDAKYRYAGKSPAVSDFILKPFGEFSKRFFLWKGYRDGLHGLALSILQSFYEFIVVAKAWESAGFKDKDIDKKAVVEDVKKGFFEICYWNDKEANLIKKIVNKVKYFLIKSIR